MHVQLLFGINQFGVIFWAAYSYCCFSVVKVWLKLPQIATHYSRLVFWWCMVSCCSWLLKETGMMLAVTVCVSHFSWKWNTWFHTPSLALTSEITTGIARIWSENRLIPSTNAHKRSTHEHSNPDMLHS